MSYLEQGVVASHLREVPRLTRFVREPFEGLQPSQSDWLVKNLLPARGYGFLAGPSQSRKSFLALEWSLRIALGEDILGHRTKQAGVVYVASEGASGVRKRVAAWRARSGVGSVSFDMIAQAPDLRNQVQVDDLIAVLSEARSDLEANGERLGLVVIDTLAASTPGADENSGADMSALLANAQRIGSETGAFVLVISHTGKDETRGLRGWSGQFAGADTVVMLSRDETSGQTHGVVRKQKDGEDGFKFAFRLDPVPLGFDDDGDEVSSCIVAYEAAGEAGQAGGRRALTAEQTLLLRAVQLCIDAGQVVSVIGPDLVERKTAVSRVAMKARLFTIGYSDGDDNPETIRRRINRLVSGLIGRNLLFGDDRAVWLP